MRTKNRLGAFLIVLILSCVPLIVSGCLYRIGLKQYAWFSDADTTYDFFLYWKGRALILICGLLALYVAVKQIMLRGNWMELEGAPGCGGWWMDKKYVIPLVLYLGLALLSTVLSPHRDMAAWGGYEQWEGMIIVAAYAVILFFTYFLIGGKTEVRIVMWGLLAGVLVLSFLSARQCFGHDFFRTENGQAVMNFMLKKKLKFTFNFPLGRVYSTLYNPNYVGSYVALMLPVVLSFISVRKNICSVMRSLLAAAAGVLLVIMLFGSESVTGCIGIFAVLVLAAAFFVAHNKNHPRRIFITAGVCTAAVVVGVWMNRPIFEYGVNKILHPTPNHFVVKSVESKEGALHIRTVRGDLLKLRIRMVGERYEYEAEDGSGKWIEMYRDEETGKMKFRDDRFLELELGETTVEPEGEAVSAVDLETPSVGKTYTVIPEEGYETTYYLIYNVYGKVDQLRHIPSIGFEQNQHFGSRRGYIWSRTFPLLKRHLLLGSGPNTFVYEFPNNDYVGMKNVGYDGAIVTKPHNMFLQIWVQTGFLSLLAFLALYALYFVESMRMYFFKPVCGWGERVGIGILLGTFGYLVTGFANDSTVAVAPLYWCLLGVGMAVNRYNRKTKSEVWQRYES